MDNLTDKEKLLKGILPCCGNKIKKYLTNTRFPLCEKDNCYFTFAGSNNEFVIRNDNAKTLNDEIWENEKKISIDHIKKIFYKNIQYT